MDIYEKIDEMEADIEALEERVNLAGSRDEAARAQAEIGRLREKVEDLLEQEGEG